MVFCNYNKIKIKENIIDVTILILVDGFLQLGYGGATKKRNDVTILILVDGFLQ